MTSDQLAFVSLGRVTRPTQRASNTTAVTDENNRRSSARSSSVVFRNTGTVDQRQVGDYVYEERATERYQNDPRSAQLMERQTAHIANRRHLISEEDPNYNPFALDTMTAGFELPSVIKDNWQIIAAVGGALLLIKFIKSRNEPDNDH